MLATDEDDRVLTNDDGRRLQLVGNDEVEYEYRLRLSTSRNAGSHVDDVTRCGFSTCCGGLADGHDERRRLGILQVPMQQCPLFAIAPSCRHR